MQIRPIHTPADYKAALKEVSALVDAHPLRSTPDADRLDILGYFTAGLPTLDLLGAALPARAIRPHRSH